MNEKKTSIKVSEKAIIRAKVSEKKILKKVSKPKSQYKTVYEWKEVAPEYFDVAMQNGWLNKVCDEIGWEYYEEEKDITFIPKKGSL
ncbi:hypothetical protein NO995_09690 [Aestuariibaculum sp. M13]|uniref:hypothetical protein n=1 Tax=Aestuariibaculum sp. M13 TaxID=2967132 RepID=UPI002159E850|nr:hypothetical protein [Aestuariibaculum sp. M13]MCR8667953.1 hypothetical protein [Aestuariibaculum sp. M13]